jgi:hypothetical protein
VISRAEEDMDVCNRKEQSISLATYLYPPEAPRMSDVNPR